MGLIFFSSITELQGHAIKNQDLLIASGAISLKGAEGMNAVDDDVAAAVSLSFPVSHPATNFHSSNFSHFIFLSQIPSIALYTYSRPSCSKTCNFLQFVLDPSLLSDRALLAPDSALSCPHFTTHDLFEIPLSSTTTANMILVRRRPTPEVFHWHRLILLR
jgi:hypothetical protein